MTKDFNNINQLCIDNIRMVCLEAIDKAQSGHLGAALSGAPVMHTLYTKFMNVTKENPNWINRDRLVLSSGHASSLLYTTLHLCGYIKKEDVINFRQLGSITTGHPEVGVCPGVDVSTGPLGQGVATGVGIAIAERFLNNLYPELINHHTFVMCGDGDVEEGACLEALSFAGLQKLNKLVIIYDSNDIQLDGKVEKVLKEDNKKKYEAMGFNYYLIKDGFDLVQVEKTIKKAMKSDKPVFIETKTIIGVGTSGAGTNKVHGSMLPKGEVAEIRKEFGGDEFDIEKAVYDYYKKNSVNRGKRAYKNWLKVRDSYDPKKLEEFNAYFDSSNIDYSKLPNFDTEDKKNYSLRKACTSILYNLQEQYKGLLGGSADLGSSVGTIGLDGDMSAENPNGRNILFGVREHAMGCIANGITLYGLRAFASTFFAFSDYMKDTVRMAAISRVPTLYVFSHDSIAVGEDGPTHQPIEQITTMRSIPNCVTYRPADANEAKVSYELSMKELTRPSVIIISRQNYDYVSPVVSDMYKGGYIASIEKGALDGIIIASGSEVPVAIKAQKLLEEEGIYTRVVSMMSTNLFDEQSSEYKEKILPRKVTKRMVVEMSDAIHMYKYLDNLSGKSMVLNMSVFGVSGKMKDVLNHYGFNPENVAKKYKEIK